MYRPLFFFVFGLAVVSARRVNFFRKDYTYYEEYDAYYKLHNDVNGRSWNSSFLACDEEGAQLFFPSTVNEWEVVSKLVQAAGTPVADVEDIFVGIHDQFALGEYVTLNGQSTNISIENLDTTSDLQHCVTMDIQTGVYKASECDVEAPFRPFVCKKVEDVSCPTIDKGYIYVKETRKCYKVNENARTWSKAMETCFMEGGSLVTFGSYMETEIVRKLLDQSHVYHAGFKKMFPINEFYTVKGHKLQDSGYNYWYNEDRKNNYDCGAISTDSNRIHLYAYHCDSEILPFICEMDVTV